MHVLTGLGAGVGELSSLLVPIDGAYLHANKSLLIHFPFPTSENQRAFKKKKKKAGSGEDLVKAQAGTFCPRAVPRLGTHLRLRLSHTRVQPGTSAAVLPPMCAA